MFFMSLHNIWNTKKVLDGYKLKLVESADSSRLGGQVSKNLKNFKTSGALKGFFKLNLKGVSYELT